MSDYEPTEDAPYAHIDDFAIEDPDTAQQVSQENNESRKVAEIKRYIKAAILEHNSFDVLNLPANAKPEEKMAVFDEIAIHKGVAMHLRNIEAIINR